ncbi:MULTISPECIES: hypothetical protein [Aquabacterium]|jgi:hypothetical protein|uniref:hypothetical protein n=1 Tax=Aquabacterium TaxID=92793 RepID=UPI000718CCEB|nr:MULTISPECIES: hypothetical protein [Aquabacterium]MBU0916144.1 hypothetical protein [Gammaproteobacteria bacterium]
MAAYLSLLLAFVVGAALCSATRREARSWLASCAVVPAFVLVSEFVLPYSGGGASMWPIALAFGGFMGALAGGAGVLLASWLHNKRA